MQMLQYYPNLLTSQPPPPLTDADFSRLPSVMVSCDALGLCSYDEKFLLHAVFRSFCPRIVHHKQQLCCMAQTGS